MQSLPIDLQPVRQGPRAYRNRLRRLGPVLGLVPPGVLGGAALLLLRGNESTVRGLAGFLLAVLAAPVLLLLGAPLEGGDSLYVAAAVASGVLWLTIGVVASRRATRSPVASWRDFWREYLWLAGGVWIGVLGALVAANLLLGRTLV